MEAKLSRKITFDFLETPLEKAVEILSAKTGINIKIDPQVKTKGKEVTLRVEEMRFEAALHWIARLLDLWWEIKDNVIILEQIGMGKIIKKPYDISPHIYMGGDNKDDLSFEEYLKITIKKSICPEVWVKNKHAIRIKKGKLEVFAPGHIHRMIEGLFYNLEHMSILDPSPEDYENFKKEYLRDHKKKDKIE
jgi:hypothetical protein